MTRIAFHAAGARSLIPAIDAVLIAVESDDEAALLRLVTLSDVPCVVRPSGVGSLPKCPEGVADGTAVSLFPLDFCEGHFADRQEVSERLQSIMALHPRLFAVHEYAGPTPFRGTTRDFVAVFGFQEDQPSGVFNVYIRKDGALTGIAVCGGYMNLQQVGKMLIAPK